MAGVYGIMVGGVRSGGTALQNSHTTGIGTPWGLTVTSSVVPVIGAWSIGTMTIGDSCARAVAGASAGVMVSIAALRKANAGLSQRLEHLIMCFIVLFSWRSQVVTANAVVGLTSRICAYGARRPVGTASG